MNGSEYYQAGQLQEAITAQLEEVKKNPGELSCRGFLCELLCFAGDLERADKHLDSLSQQHLESALGIVLFRQLVRAEQTRQECLREGRMPEFLGKPSRVTELHLQASICLREGKQAEAAKLLAESEEVRPKISGKIDGESFGDFRDLDDLTAPFFEVLTSTGKYYWIPLENVESAEFHAPERPRDLLWRRVHMIVKGGPDGEVFVPALYPGSDKSENDGIRLGRATEWQGEDDEPIRGLGQRTFLVGDNDVPIMNFKEIIFDTNDN